MSSNSILYSTKQNAPTAEYDALDMAYDHFNAMLFEGRLPLVMITLRGGKRVRGYFAPERFSSRTEETNAHELAMNVDHFEGRADKEILSTLVHEMTHVYQHVFGNPSRGGYHNSEWAGIMENVGLIASDTGQPGGKRTGQRVTHYIVDGGPFDKACADLLSSGFALTWQSKKSGGTDKPKAKKDKVKYTCPDCKTNAWGKPRLHLVCGECQLRLCADDDNER
jgi:predicted SprT family Zn-dependent metalloprotease